MSESRPPLRARLHRYKLTATELVVLQAMVEHCSDGSTIWASIRRIAAYSNLCERTVQRVINGVNRNGRHIPGLCERGILLQLAPANVGKHRPATYRLNEQACEEDPRMAPYLTHQQQLPGIRRPPIPGEPIPDHPLVTQGHQAGDTRSSDLVTQSHQPGVTGSPDSKAFDPKALDSKTGIHHGDAAMTISPSATPSEEQARSEAECGHCVDTGLRPNVSNPREKVICKCSAGQRVAEYLGEAHPGDATLNAMPAWMAVKEQLRSELSLAEWDLWVRPMLLMKVMPVDGERKHFLAALPPNSRIQSAALSRLSMMRELLAPAGLNISLTRYPDEYEIREAKKRYDVDMAPQPWKRES